MINLLLISMECVFKIIEINGMELYWIVIIGKVFSKVMMDI